jgi:single-strand DNA-binding protein
MSDINSVIVVGRVVEKPALKYLSSGTAVTDIRIANNTYQGQGKEDKVNWLTVTVFGARAESCEKYLDKGSQCVVKGKLDYQAWTNKDGDKRSMVKIKADEVQFVGKKSNQDQPQSQEQSQQNQPASEPAQPAESKPADQQQDMNMPEPDTGNDFNSQFDSPIDDTDDIPF